MLLKEWGPLLGPNTGLLSNNRKWIVQGDTSADKARDFIGKGHRGREQESKGTQENCSVTWLAVSGFMVMGLVSGLSLANPSDSVLSGGAALFSQDECQRGFWEVVRQVVSPFDLSQTLMVGGGLLVPCSLPGPPVVKQLMQMVTMVPGQGEWFQSLCFPWQLPPRDFILKILPGDWGRGLFFCNFFLLCMGIGLSSRAKVSLYLI